MDASTIIGQLTSDDGLPRNALRAAAKRREEMAPLFIAEIEEFIAAGPAGRLSANALFFMFHLLGDWRETSAYPALARLLHLPEDEVNCVLGDAVTETSHRVMAAVFDGDPAPLYDIIRDPDASEFVRARMCEVLAMVVRAGKLDRDAAAGFLRDCFTELQPQDANYVWHGWQAAIAMLCLKEFTPVVEMAFERRYIDPAWCAFDDFQADMDQALAAPGVVPWNNDGSHELFGDTIEELSGWHGFSEERQRKQDRQSRDLTGPASEQAVNPYKSVGRNDPCPCGSGKKFKKCCLQ